MLIKHLVFFTSFPNFFLTILFTFREKNITGNAETPFLLARVNEITGGASLASSILKR